MHNNVGTSSNLDIITNGNWSKESIVPVPITTLSPIVGWRLFLCFPVHQSVTLWYRIKLSPISVVSPITVPIPWSINQPFPSFAHGCISIPVSKRIIFENSGGMLG